MDGQDGRSEAMDKKQRRDRIKTLIDEIHAGQSGGRAAAISAMLDFASSGQDETFAVFRELLRLREVEKLAAGELAPHVSRILHFWESLYAKVKALQQDGPGIE